MNNLLEDRRAQIAAGGIAAAGAAVLGGRAALAQKGLVGTDHGDSRGYRFRRDEEPAAAVRRVAVGRIDSALEHLRGEVDEDRAATVHECRKDLKKLRSLLRLVRNELGDHAYRRENDRFRDAGRLLAGTRDAQVKLETLEALSGRFALESRDARWGPLASALRADAERAATSEDKVEEAAKAIAAGRDRVERWPIRSDGWELLDGGLRRGYRRGRRRFSEAVAGPDEVTVHEWRKRVKDLWYHLRLLRDSKPKRVGAMADAAHQLSDLLGDHHDLAMLDGEANAQEEVLSRSDRELLSTLIEAHQKELLARAIALGDQLYAERPRAFAKRLRGYWEDSR
jgi:CHAD domain-containing protein